MKTNSSHLIRNAAYWTAFSFLAGSSFLLAQDSANTPPQSDPPQSVQQEQSSAPDGAWHKMGGAPPPADANASGNPANPNPADPGNPNPANADPQNGNIDPNAPPPQNAPPMQAAPPNAPPPQTGTQNNGPYQGPPNGYQGPNDAPYSYPAPNQNPNQRPGAPNYPPPSAAVPPRLTLPSGSFITVRINQPLSSDHNHTGDAFSASLMQPIIVDGVIVAQRGQTIGGHVTEAQKAARSSDTPSRLGVQLTDLTLVDGQVVPIQTQFLSMTGPSSAGRNAGAIVGTTALGAAIGAAVGWGPGAAIGAGAGAAAGTIGVLVARGRPTIIPPESVLTFRVEAPVTIATDRAPQAFRYLNTNNYNQAPGMQSRMAPGAGPGYGYGPPPPPAYYGYGYGYGYPYYPYYYGPGVGLYFGPGFYYGRGFYRGGFRR